MGSPRDPSETGQVSRACTDHIGVDYVLPELTRQSRINSATSRNVDRHVFFTHFGLKQKWVKSHL